MAPTVRQKVASGWFIAAHRPADLFIEKARLRIRSAALAVAEYAQNLDLTFERDRDDVARSDRFRRRLDARRIHPDASFAHKLCRERPALNDACEPQPFVNPLARFCRLVHEARQLTEASGNHVRACRLYASLQYELLLT